jgi:hypothetical protein
VTSGDVAALVIAAVAVVTLAGGYIQFVLRRSGFGYIEFDVEFARHYREPPNLIVELDFVFKNVGSNMVLVRRIRCRAKYRSAGDDKLTKEVESPTKRAEPNFPHLIADEPADRKIPEGYFPVIRRQGDWPTFIQPGVTQHYRKPIMLPAEAQVLHVWGSFDYEIKVTGLARLLLPLATPAPPDVDMRQGVANHTVRRTFSLDEPASFSG